MCLGDIITSIEGGASVWVNLARSGLYIKEKAYLLTEVISLSVNSILTRWQEGMNAPFMCKRNGLFYP